MSKLSGTQHRGEMQPGVAEVSETERRNPVVISSLSWFSPLCLQSLRFSGLHLETPETVGSRKPGKMNQNLSPVNFVLIGQDR